VGEAQPKTGARLWHHCWEHHPCRLRCPTLQSRILVGRSSL